MISRSTLLFLCRVLLMFATCAWVYISVLVESHKSPLFSLSLSLSISASPSTLLSYVSLSFVRLHLCICITTCVPSLTYISSIRHISLPSLHLDTVAIRGTGYIVTPVVYSTASRHRCIHRCSSAYIAAWPSSRHRYSSVLSTAQDGRCHKHPRAMFPNRCVRNREGGGEGRMQRQRVTAVGSSPRDKSMDA